MNHRLRILCIGLILAFVPGQCPAAERRSPAAPSIDGIWRWSFTMPDGTVAEPRLLLEAGDGELQGTASFRPGTEVSITNALLRGNQLRFEVIRSRGEREILTTYWGTWSGSTIRGKVSSNWAGPTQTYSWEAHRSHEGATGLWTWTTSFGGRTFEARVRLDQEGESLTGYVPGSGRGAARRIRISRGSVEDGHVQFEIARGAGANRVVNVYRGKQSGDSIVGTIQTSAGGRRHESPWEAHRQN